MTSTFGEATAVTPISSHTYSAHFPDDWCIGSVPHGGFVTSVFLRVAETHFNRTLSAQNQPHTIALHLDFLRRTQTGPALFTVRDTKLGRQASVIHVTLTQGDGPSAREEVVGSITNSNMYMEEGVTLSTGYALHPPPPAVDLALLQHDRDASWARQTNMPFARFRRAAAKIDFHYPRAGQLQRNLGDEWIRLASGERWSNAALGYVADSWPMPVEAFVNEKNPYAVVPGAAAAAAPARFWYPTVLLNLDIKKPLPAEGAEWLFVRVAAKEIRNGRMDLEIVILDAEGGIVALSHHVSLAVDAGRNLAERRTGANI